VMQKPTAVSESKIKTQVENGVDPNAVPNFPTAVPATDAKQTAKQDDKAKK